MKTLFSVVSLLTFALTANVSNSGETEYQKKRKAKELLDEKIQRIDDFVNRVNEDKSGLQFRVPLLPNLSEENVEDVLNLISDLEKIDFSNRYAPAPIWIDLREANGIFDFEEPMPTGSTISVRANDGEDLAQFIQRHFPKRGTKRAIALETRHIAVSKAIDDELMKLKARGKTIRSDVFMRDPKTGVYWIHNSSEAGYFEKEEFYLGLLNLNRDFDKGESYGHDYKKQEALAKALGQTYEPGVDMIHITDGRGFIDWRDRLGEKTVFEYDNFGSADNSIRDQLLSSYIAEIKRDIERGEIELESQNVNEVSECKDQKSPPTSDHEDELAELTRMLHALGPV